MSGRRFRKLTTRLLGRFDNVGQLLDEIEGSAVQLQTACDEEAGDGAPDGAARRPMPARGEGGFPVSP